MQNKQLKLKEETVKSHGNIFNDVYRVAFWGDKKEKHKN